jgi:hypothetical protein
MTTLRTLSASVLLLGATACGNSFQAATPPGFVELEDQTNYDYRATNADGLVIAVREIDHDPKGTVDFWTRAIENRMRQRGGYALLGSKDVKTAAGIPGKQLRFGHDEGNKPHVYHVTLFVTDDTLYVLEAGGTKDQIDRHAAELDWTVQNFRIK